MTDERENAESPAGEQPESEQQTVEERAAERESDVSPGDEEREPHEADTRRDHDALLDRLRVIEDQPLESRAEAFGHLHDELRARLEASDARG